MTTALENVNALLISNPVNIRYLTGFWGANPEEREAYVLIRGRNAFLFTNALYLEQAKMLPRRLRIKNLELRIWEISREKPLTNRLKEILTPKIHQLEFEEVDLTVAEFQKLKTELPQIKLVPTRNRIENLRMYKRPDELKNIKAAARLTDRCFEHVTERIKPKVGETELAWEIETFFRQQGAATAFSPIVAFNQNSAIPHYTPSHDQRLKTNDLILLDFGAQVNGYCADMTRVVFFGKPSAKHKKVYQTVLEAQLKTLVLLETGERNGQVLDQEARRVITSANLPTYPHSLGHSLGLSIHESPRLSEKQETQLKPGVVFTLEPGVYLTNKFGIRIEDLVYLNEQNKLEILSKSPKELVVI